MKSLACNEPRNTRVKTKPKILGESLSRNESKVLLHIVGGAIMSNYTRSRVKVND